MRNALAALLLWTASAAPALAQVRTFNVEDALPLPAGTAAVSIGASWGRDHEEPVYGLRGTLLQAPAVEGRLSLGGVAELQVSGGLRTLWIDARTDAPMSSILEIPGDRTSAPQDAVVATKVRLVTERGWRPVLSVRLATKLPNAGNESGLGSDTTDFSFGLLASWHRRSWRLTTTLGSAIVGDPSQVGVQHDPTLYGVSVGRGVGTHLELVGEVSGRWLPRHPSRPGSEDRADLRVGLQRTFGRWRADAAVVAGLAQIDSPIGGSVTFTRELRVRVP